MNTCCSIPSTVNIGCDRETSNKIKVLQLTKVQAEKLRINGKVQIMRDRKMVTVYLNY